MATVRAAVTCSGVPESAAVTFSRGREGMNELATWQIGVVTDEAGLDVSALIGASASITLADEAEDTTRVVGLVITEVESLGAGPDGMGYVLSLASPGQLLAHRSNHRVWLEKTTKEIVADVLQKGGVPGDEVEWRLQGSYLPRRMCVQYGETDWAFVERLLADEGIGYTCDAEDDGKPLLVLADNPGAHEDISGSATIPYEDAGGLVQYRHFFELEARLSSAPTAAAVRDYDVRAPDVPIDGTAGKDGLEYFEYPANVPTSEMAGVRAKVRLQQLRRDVELTEAKSNCVRLRPGHVVVVDACADEWMNGRYLILRVEHELVQGSRNATDTRAYSNRVVLMPLRDMTYRPAPPRARPRVDGVEPGIVTGAAGEEIDVDDLGRITVRFAWDRSGIQDEKSSTRVRSAQMQLSGSMQLPRMGWELPIAYIDGNPDLPVALGRVYNGAAVVPYGLPGKKATTTFQSATSPGGGSTNEIRMGDDGGSQEMFVHATKNQDVTVGGTAATKVGANETHDVNLALLSGITASQTWSIGASQTINVGTDYATDIKGGRNETVGGAEFQKITANRVVAVKGGYTELIGAVYGIQCNQANYSVKGAFTELVGAAMALGGGLGVAETVVAARTEVVGAAKKITSAGPYSEKVRGAKNVTAGPTTEKSGGGMLTTGKAAASTLVGGTVTLTASGPMVIEAPTITIQAATLDAKELKLKGGTVHLKGGKSKFKGNIKRKGKFKLQG